jgi:hypothetical protein
MKRDADADVAHAYADATHMLGPSVAAEKAAVCYASVCEVHPSALAHATVSSVQGSMLEHSTRGHSAPCCRNHCAAAS